MAIDFNKVPRYIRAEIDPPKKTLKAGQRNPSAAVKRIQEWLQYHHCRTAIDGDFGPATASCVKDFQQKKKIKANGIVNTETWNALVKPMIESLKPPKVNKKDSIAVTIEKVAVQHVNQHPVEIGGDNCGPWVRLYCEGNEGRQWAWCAGFVTTIMQQAYFYREMTPPIKGSVSCDTLAAQAKNAGRFVSEKSLKTGKTDWAAFGGACVFLKRRTSTDWVHTGIATGIEGEDTTLLFHTIEGNTNSGGHREGFEACRRKRSFSGPKSTYDFISFSEFD